MVIFISSFKLAIFIQNYFPRRNNLPWPGHRETRVACEVMLTMSSRTLHGSWQRSVHIQVPSEDRSTFPPHIPERPCGSAPGRLRRMARALQSLSFAVEQFSLGGGLFADAITILSTRPSPPRFPGLRPPTPIPTIPTCPGRCVSNSGNSVTVLLSTSSPSTSPAGSSSPRLDPSNGSQHPTT